tara:strand:- start:716 stop:1141 length:426 start_codon:yes stop_codon:yes gene_type:complete
MSQPKSKRPSPQMAAGSGAKEDANSGLSFETESTAGHDPDSHASTLFRENAKPAFVQIEASALMPGIECPFTDGCAEAGGKVRIHSDIQSMVTNELGKTAPIRQQQFRCNRCNVIAKGTKVISGGQASAQRLFNRVTGRTE